APIFTGRTADHLQGTHLAPLTLLSDNGRLSCWEGSTPRGVEACPLRTPSPRSSTAGFCVHECHETWVELRRQLLGMDSIKDSRDHNQVRLTAVSSFYFTSGKWSHQTLPCHSSVLYSTVMLFWVTLVSKSTW
ncbi:hypothetical protein LEMLEM_LOCUS23228, partial [Lemmus lemmus]